MEVKHIIIIHDLNTGKATVSPKSFTNEDEAKNEVLKIGEPGFEYAISKRYYFNAPVNAEAQTLENTVVVEGEQEAA